MKPDFNDLVHWQTLHPQADALSDSIGGRCDRRNIKLEDYKPLGSDIDLKPGAASKKGRPKALTPKNTIFEPSRASIINGARHRGKPANSAKRPAPTIAEHFFSMGAPTDSIRKPNGSFKSASQRDIECNNYATVGASKVEAPPSKSCPSSLCGSGDAVPAEGLRSTPTKLTNIFDISFATTTSSPSSAAPCLGPATADTHSVTTAPLPVATPLSNNVSDTLFKKPQDYKSPPFPRADLLHSPSSGSFPFCRPHQFSRPVSFSQSIPSWFQPRLVPSSLGITTAMPRKATVISPEMVFKKAPMLSAVPMDHPYSKEPSVA